MAGTSVRELQTLRSIDRGSGVDQRAGHHPRLRWRHARGHGLAIEAESEGHAAFIAAASRGEDTR
jgi:hypothetical protein